MMRVVFLLFTLCVLSTLANPAIEKNDNTVQNLSRHQFEESFMKKLNSKCTQRDNSSCLMLKWMAYMNRMFKKSSIDIGHNFEVTQTRGVEVVQESDDDLMMARSARSDDETLSFLVADKVWNFFRSRTLRYKMMDDAEIIVSPEARGNVNIGLSINTNRAFETGRGKLISLAPLLAAIATKVGIVGALVFKALVLLVGKALIVSKLALLLAVILGLKKLLAKKHVTYEVVAHPHHSESHHGHDSYSSAGWGRALEGFFEGLDSVPQGNELPDAQEQAYGGGPSQ